MEVEKFFAPDMDTEKSFAYIGRAIEAMRKEEPGDYFGAVVKPQHQLSAYEGETISLRMGFTEETAARLCAISKALQHIGFVRSIDFSSSEIPGLLLGGSYYTHDEPAKDSRLRFAPLEWKDDKGPRFWVSPEEGEFNGRIEIEAKGFRFSVFGGRGRVFSYLTRVAFERLMKEAKAVKPAGKARPKP